MKTLLVAAVSVLSGAPAAAQSRVDFVLPFEKALERARSEGRLLFIKPIYGGVDELGAKDYCEGSW